MSDYWLGVLTIPALMLGVGALAWSAIGIGNLIDEVRFLIAKRRNDRGMRPAPNSTGPSTHHARIRWRAVRVWALCAHLVH